LSGSIAACARYGKSNSASIFVAAPEKASVVFPVFAADAPGVFVAASDYLKALPDAIDRWLPRKLVSLGTDGFGRSEARADLRNHFEVDARFIVIATLSALMRDGKLDAKVVQKAIADLGINAEKANPATA
jgi:pyruvate dehydrogenase E1 component